MKWLLVLAGCAILLPVFAGCAQQNQQITKPPEIASQADKDEFPEIMVGIWQADKDDWAFKFERDGTILRVVHMLAGPVKMEEGGIYEDGPDPGTFAYFAMGPCETKYNPANHQLSVKIFLDEFHMQFPTGDLKGRMEDHFDGPISDDGRTWAVSWRNYCWLEGASPLDINSIEQNPEKLVFTKMDVNDVNDVNDVK